MSIESESIKTRDRAGNQWEWQSASCYLAYEKTHTTPSCDTIHHLKLTKFVNGYFRQDDSSFTRFLMSQPNLELHSGTMNVSKRHLSLDRLETLGCPLQFFDREYSLARLWLNFDNSTDDCEIDVLKRVLNKDLTLNMKSLALFLRQEQSHFAEIMRVIAGRNTYIQHLEIHQFLPTQVRS